MQEKSTDELDAQLRNTTPDCMDKYYKENRYYIAETSKAFTYYMKDVIDKKISHFVIPNYIIKIFIPLQECQSRMEKKYSIWRSIRKIEI